MMGIAFGIILLFFITGWLGIIAGYILRWPILLLMILFSGLRRERAVPIVYGANRTRGLCASCGHGNLVYRHETVQGERDMRYGDNPLKCISCNWKGSLSDSYAALQNVEAQVARIPREQDPIRVLPANISNTVQQLDIAVSATSSPLTPITLGENSRRGLCPVCGHGSLRYAHETISGSPDLRYKQNSLWCLKCNWRGGHIEAWAAAQSVLAQLASANTRIQEGPEDKL